MEFETELKTFSKNNEDSPSSRLRSLTPLLDSDGLGRVLGRLGNAIHRQRLKAEIQQAIHWD